MVAQQLQRLDPALGVGPQRVARHRQGVAARGVDGGAQVGDELGVPGHPVGPVEHDADQWPIGTALGSRTTQAGAVPHLGQRQRAGRLEPEAAHQHRVGHEPQQLLDVRRTARRRGSGGRRGRSRRGRSTAGQLGVGVGLAAQGHEGDAGRRAAGPQLVERLPQAPRPPSRRTTTAVTPSSGGAPSSRPRVRRPHGGKPSGSRWTIEPRASNSVSALLRNRIIGRGLGGIGRGRAGGRRAVGRAAAGTATGLGGAPNLSTGQAQVGHCREFGRRPPIGTGDGAGPGRRVRVGEGRGGPVGYGWATGRRGGRVRVGERGGPSGTGWATGRGGVAGTGGSRGRPRR